jgi:hypothetical protein
VLTVGPDQVSADLSNDSSGVVVILGLKNGMYFELNDVGARIWHLVQQPQSVQAIVDALLAEYEVSAEQCENDVISLMTDMLQRGLVVIVDGPGT